MEQTAFYDSGSGKTKHRNPFVLHVWTGMATQEQLAYSVRCTLEEMDKELHKMQEKSPEMVYEMLGEEYTGFFHPDNTIWRANVITKTTKIPAAGGLFVYKTENAGYGYIFFKDKRLVNYFDITPMGDGKFLYRNFLGDNRVKAVYKPAKKRDPITTGSLSFNIESLSWADLVESEEPTMEYLGPAIEGIDSLFLVEPTSEQVEAFVREKGGIPLEEDMYFEFQTSRAHVSSVKDNIVKNGVVMKESPNVLVSNFVPTWVTTEMLMPYFSHFNTKNETVRVKIAGQEREFVYPWIERVGPFTTMGRDGAETKNYRVFVTYSPDRPYDSSWSLQINRKFTLVDDKTGNVAKDLVFQHYVSAPKDMSRPRKGVGNEGPTQVVTMEEHASSILHTRRPVTSYVGVAPAHNPWAKAKAPAKDYQAIQKKADEAFLQRSSAIVGAAPLTGEEILERARHAPAISQPVRETASAAPRVAPRGPLRTRRLQDTPADDEDVVTEERRGPRRVDYRDYHATRPSMEVWRRNEVSTAPARATSPIRPAREASRPAREASRPAREASPPRPMSPVRVSSRVTSRPVSKDVSFARAVSPTRPMRSTMPRVVESAPRVFKGPGPAYYAPGVTPSAVPARVTSPTRRVVAREPSVPRQGPGPVYRTEVPVEEKETPAPEEATEPAPEGWNYQIRGRAKKKAPPAP